MKLLTGLQVVASVGPHKCLWLRYDTDAVGAAETANEFDSLITGSQVLRVVTVAMWYNIAVNLVLCHQ